MTPRRALAWALVPVRAVVLAIAACCVVIVVTGLPAITPRGAWVLVAALAAFWGERLRPTPWLVAWWLGGFFGVAPYVAIVVALAFRCARRPLVSRWPLAVAVLGFTFRTVFDGQSNLERPHPPHADLVCLGDSSPAGIEVAEPYCAILGGENFAVPGSTPADSVTQWRAARSLRPRVVLWQSGPNRRGDDGTALRASLDTIAREAAVAGARLIVIDYPTTLWPEPAWRRQTREALPDGVPLIDPRLPWWEVNGDHLHPTAAGHRRIAAAVSEAIP